MTELEKWLPSNLKYDASTYMWARYEQASDTVFIGVAQPTLNSLGDLAYLALAEPGDKVQSGKSAGSMEAAKMTGEILSPVSGKVVKRNEQVLGNPNIVNQDPYRDGWLLEISPDSWPKDADELLDCNALYEILPEELRGGAQQEVAS